MLVYTCPIDDIAEMDSIYRSAVPADIANRERIADDAIAFTEIMAWANAQMRGWAREARLATSQGKWLLQHAADRGVAKQDGESDVQLRARISNPPDAVTLPAIQAALDALAAAAGILQPCYVIEITPSSGGGECFVGYGITTTALSFCNRGARAGRDQSRSIVLFIVPLALAGSTADEIRTKLPPGRRYLLETY